MAETGSIVVDTFRAGMDRRRERVAGVPGALWTGENCHITRGGDIERAKKFVPVFTLPEGTHSLAAVRGQLYVFGSDDIANEVPLGVQYQRLVAPDSAVMIGVVDVGAFSGKNYVAAEYDDGDLFHYYDGSRVSDWDAFVAATPTAIAARLADKVNSSTVATAAAFGAVITITAKTPGTGFTISVNSVNGGGDSSEDITVTQLQANLAGVAEVLATADVTITGGTLGSLNKITSITIDGVEMMSDEAAWTGSNAATAIVVAGLITNLSDDHGYTAAADGAVVTITAPVGSGDTENGLTVVVTTTGDVTVSADATMTGGVTEVDSVAQVERVTVSGTTEIEDTFTITLDSVEYKVTGLASGMGTSVFTHKSRVWSTVGSEWRYCMLFTPTVWDPANVTTDNDAGAINISEDTSGNADLVGASVYQGLAAVFSDDTITLYSIDVNPDNNAYSDSLENTGTIAGKSIVRYGNNDLFYLDYTGVRSVQARQGTVAPYVTDAGSPIDPFIQEYLKTLTPAQVQAAKAVIEPQDGRLWVAVGERIFVLSRFPDAGINAWTYYSPGFEVDAFARIGKRLYVRSGNTIYLYGGEDGETYPAADESIVRVGLPFLGNLLIFKELEGFDIACTNEWDVDILYDPENEDRTFPVGAIAEITYNEMHISAAGPGAVFAPSLVCAAAGRATLSSLAMHYRVVKKVA